MQPLKRLRCILECFKTQFWYLISLLDESWDVWEQAMVPFRRELYTSNSVQKPTSWNINPSPRYRVEFLGCKAMYAPRVDQAVKPARKHKPAILEVLLLVSRAVPQQHFIYWWRTSRMCMGKWTITPKSESKSNREKQFFLQRQLCTICDKKTKKPWRGNEFTGRDKFWQREKRKTALPNLIVA